MISNDENINPFAPSKNAQNAQKAQNTVGSNAYDEARNALRSAGRLVGREAERDELEAFLSSRLANHKPGAIYVSGPPGTGKSATVTEVLEKYSTKKSFVNCVSLKDASGVYAKLLADFGVEELSALHKLWGMKDRSHLVVLDEVDQASVEFLYTIFQWSLQKSSNLVLVGIANALDFTDRFLPRLRCKGLKPQLLPFMPYTVAQIVSIVSTKLKSTLAPDTDFVPFIHPMALQFAAKKVAAQTGDLRKVFSLCLRAIDLVECEATRKTPLAENKALSPAKALSPVKLLVRRDSATQFHTSDFTVENAPRVTIAHMARVTASVFSNGTSSRLASLNLQQKAALCALCVLDAKQRSHIDANGNSLTLKKTSASTMKTLYETYSQLCHKDNAIHALSSIEFCDVVGSLEAQSLVVLVDGRNGSLTPTKTPSRRGRGAFSEEKRVASCVAFREVCDSLNGPGAGVLKGLMEDLR